MSNGHFHIPMQEIMAIQVKLSDKAGLEAFSKRFQYDQSRTMNQNLNQLTKMLANYLNVRGKTSETLANYLVEKNIPIQVNFKPLKVEQLVNILEQWLSMHTEGSTILEKLYTNKHRNIHFRRILFDQQQTINDYFQTLSDKKMLKAVNLYQLLVQILSNCYLYEFRSDSQTFFEKVNSFNTFVDIVNKFIHSEKRISLAANKEDFQYIQRIEFQRLIQFWEEQNNELQLLTERRINKTEISVQTKLINVVEAEAQTQSNSNLTEFINSSLFVLNKLTLLTNSAKELAIIERLYSSLRKQKIYLLGEIQDDFLKVPVYPQPQSKTPGDFSKREQMIESHESHLIVDQSQIFSKKTQRQNLIEKPKYKNEIEFARTISPNRKLNSAIETIYNYYLQIEGFTIKILQKCLIDLGAIQNYNSHLVISLIKKNFILNREHISQEQFKRIMRHLMQIDKQLTIEVLQDFIAYRKTLGVKINSPKVKSCLVSPVSNNSSFFLHHKSRNYIGKYIGDQFYL